MTSFICKALGEKIKKLRKAKGYSQEKFAEILGLGVTSLSLIETGKGFVSVSTLEKLVEALNVTPSELFKTPDDNDKKALYKRIQNRLRDIKNDEAKLALVSEFLNLIV